MLNYFYGKLLNIVFLWRCARGESTNTHIIHQKDIQTLHTFLIFHIHQKQIYFPNIFIVFLHVFLELTMWSNNYFFILIFSENKYKKKTSRSFYYYTWWKNISTKKKIIKILQFLFSKNTAFQDFNLLFISL